VYDAASSPFQRHGRWISPHGNGWNEADLRTGMASIPGDANGDGVVNVADMIVVILNWGACSASPCPGDVNGDGVVDVTDLVAVVVGWT
jgi:hypothetical protein